MNKNESKRFLIMPRAPPKCNESSQLCRACLNKFVRIFSVNICMHVYEGLSCADIISGNLKSWVGKKVPGKNPSFSDSLSYECREKLTSKSRNLRENGMTYDTTLAHPLFT